MGLFCDDLLTVRPHISLSNLLSKNEHWKPLSLDYGQSKELQCDFMQNIQTYVISTRLTNDQIKETETALV